MVLAPTSNRYLGVAAAANTIACKGLAKPPREIGPKDWAYDSARNAGWVFPSYTGLNVNKFTQINVDAND